MPMFSPPPPPLALPASRFVTVRYHRGESGDDRFEIMPNVQCISIHFVEGPTLPSAQFVYVLDDTDRANPFPYLYEDLWPMTASGPYVVEQDDELIVYEIIDGERYLRFDGFARLPQVDQSQSVAASFVAVGVHERLNDYPIEGAAYRDADDPKDTRGDDPVVTGLPVWFNPWLGKKSLPNCTPDGHDVGEGTDAAYPVFLDERLAQDPAEPLAIPAFWTLGGFVRYLFQTHNASKDENGDYWIDDPVAPTGETIDNYLKTAAPKNGNQYMDLSDPSTYTLAPIYIRSFDATGKTVMEAANEQLSYYGYHVFQNTREDPDDPGAPINEVVIYRNDGRDSVAPKEIFYPEQESLLSDGVPDFNSTSLARDEASAVNEFTIETVETEYEVSVILEAGFTIAVADALAANLKGFDKAALVNATADKRKQYREFVFDEAGLGHWDFGSSSFVTGTAASLDDVFGSPATDPNDSTKQARKYAKRLRPGQGTLFSVDGSGKPRKAELAISRGYTGAAPGLYDPAKDTDTANDWQSIADSGWNLLKDRLGVEIAVGGKHPEQWTLPKGSNSHFAGDVVRVITSLANPAGPNTRFRLRLTTTIQGDQGIEAMAARRGASPSRFTVRRVIDAKDHWRKQVVTKSSIYNATGKDKVARDDTEKAKATAESLRLEHEIPSIAGAITIPWSTLAYGIGDQISRINGRDVSFASNAGEGAGEGSRYPVVVGLSIHCQNPQSTTIKLSDRRSEAESIDHGFGRSR